MMPKLFIRVKTFIRRNSLIFNKDDDYRSILFCHIFLMLYVYYILNVLNIFLLSFYFILTYNFFNFPNFYSSAIILHSVEYTFQCAWRFKN